MNIKKNHIKIKIRNYILLFHLLVCSTFVTGQLQFNNINPENLSQLSVHTIFQDKFGFIWFGTQDGLNRYDGYQSKIFKNTANDPASISFNIIRIIISDFKSKNLLIGTDGGGISAFNFKTEKFKKIFPPPDQPTPFNLNRIYSLHVDSTGFLWVGTWGEGLYILDPSYKLLKTFKHDPNNPKSISSNKLRSIFEDSSNNIWIGTSGGGLNKYDRASSNFNIYKHNQNDPQSLSSSNVIDIFEDTQKRLWIGTDGGGLNCFDNKTGTFKRYMHHSNNPNSLSSNRIRAIFQDQTGSNLWIGTYGGGINLLNFSNDSITTIISDKRNDLSLKSNKVLSIFQDQSKLIWVGTNRGAGYHSADQNNYSYFQRFKQFLTLTEHEGIRTVIQSKTGILWIGTDGGGIHSYNPKNHKINSYKNDINDPSSLSNNRVYSIFEDSSRNLWIGTFGGGLDKFNPSSDKFIHFKPDRQNPFSISDHRIRSIIEDCEGNLWIGTWGGGLNLFDTKNNKFKRFTHQPDIANSISNNQIFHLSLDSQNKIWISTMGSGLDCYNPKTQKFTNFRQIPESPVHLSNDFVLCTYQDTEGAIWVGTLGGGLNHFNLKTGKFSHIKDPDKKMVVVYGILEDKQKNLWLSTNNGIIKYHYPSDSIFSFGLDDGLINKEFCTGAFHKTKEDLFLFGGTTSFDSLKPSQITKNTAIPPIQITSIKLFNKTFDLSQAPHLTKKLILNYDQNSLSFEFVSLNFQISKKNLYSYKMINLDDKWSHPGTRRDANYSNLQSGSYTFIVRGTNNDGVWNPVGAKIDILITPPWWKTVLFKLSLILSLLGFFLLFYHSRLKNIKLRNKELKNINYNLNEQIQENLKAKVLQRVLYQISKTVHSSLDLGELTDQIQHEISKILDTKNFFIALYDESKTKFSLPNYSDEYDSGNFFDVKGSLTSYMITSKKPLLILKNEILSLIEKKKIKLVGKMSEIWLGVPLKVNDQIIGGIVIQNYHDPKAYSHKDLQILEFISEQIASAITKKKALEESIQFEKQLRQSQKMEAIGTLAGGIAHEFNNVLGVILGYVDLVLFDLPENDPSKKNLKQVKLAGEKAKSMVKQILAFSRKNNLEKKPINLIPLINESIKLLNSTLPAHIQIKFEYQKPEVTIIADPNQINQIVMNISLNAFHSMQPRGGTLTFHLKDIKYGKSQKPYIELSITDTGKGIPNEIIDKIFEPYFTTKKVGEGTGMGLSVVHGIIQSHGGEISVQSKENIGTEFSIFFPKTEFEVPIEKNPKTVNSESLLGKEHILFVDDEQDLLHINKESLESLGYKVSVTSNPLEAIKFFKQNVSTVDILVTDLTMPELNGFELSKSLRKISPDLPIILTTGFNDVLNKSTVHSHAINSVLIKPVSKIKLAGTIRNILD